MRPRIDRLAVERHTQACARTRFRSQEISRAGGLFDTLAGCHEPVPMRWGEHDVTADPTTLAAQHRDSRCATPHRVVTDAGHWAQYEQAAHVNTRLRTWLDPQLET